MDSEPQTEHSTFSHDLKGPLTSIRMLMHLLDEQKIGPLNEKQATLVAEGKEDYDRLVGLLSPFLKPEEPQHSSIHSVPASDPANPAFTDLASGASLLGEDNFRHLAESLPQIVWTAGPDGVVDYIGPQFSMFTGLSTEAPCSLDWTKVFHPDDVEAALSSWNESLETGSIYEHELRMRSTDGTYVWFAFRGVPVSGGLNKVVKWYGTSTNIEYLKQAERSLKDSGQEKDDFIAMLGHELRNPLAAISTSFHLLDRGVLDSKQRKTAFDLMGRQLAHLARLVEDTLDITRLSSGRLKLIVETLNLNQLVTDCVGDMLALAEEQGLTISEQVHEEAVWVEGDKVRLAQCLINLLNNAIKFTEPGGKITVVLRRDAEKNSALIEVADTGVGMDSEDLLEIFQPFRQGSSARQLGRDGMGLGLAVIQEIMSLHQGGVKASSEGAGKGTVFTLTLPLCETPTKKPFENKNVTGNQTSRPQKILVIEDNRSIATAFRLFFESEGHSVTVANDGKQALNSVRKSLPDMVVCDIALPGSLKGWDIAEQIRHDFSDEEAPYLVALSGHAQPHHVRKSLESGFDQHLAKPPNPEALKKALACC